MFAFGASNARRKPALTPLIDVVFLLLVFFMLAAKFGREGAIEISGGGGSGAYEGPPRLITILPDGVLLNGSETTLADLPEALADLTNAPSDTIILRARDGADVQRLADITTLLSDAGFSRLVFVE